MDRKLALVSRIIPNERVVVEHLRGEAVLLNLSTGVYTGLDAVGTRIWELIQTRTSMDAVSAALVEEFDVAPDRAERDLFNFAEALLAAQLIRFEE